MTNKQKVIALFLFAVVVASIYFIVSFYEGKRTPVVDLTTPARTTMMKKDSMIPATPAPVPSTPDGVANAIVDDAQKDASLDKEAADAQNLLKNDASSTNSYDSTYGNKEL